MLSFLNNSKDLDLSYKTDLDFWHCFGREKDFVLLLKKYSMCCFLCVICGSSIRVCWIFVIYPGSSILWQIVDRWDTLFHGILFEFCSLMYQAGHNRTIWFFWNTSLKKKFLYVKQKQISSTHPSVPPHPPPSATHLSPSLSLLYIQNLW